jgi:hypothetical protein
MNPKRRTSFIKTGTLPDMLARTLLLCTSLVVPAMAQQPQAPNVEMQRAAMNKLNFLVGHWSGIVRIWRSSGEPAELIQTEEATYKLDGLILMIEGVGKDKVNGKVALQALGAISYDDEAGVYRMRAFNDGRWLETEVRLADSGKGLSWGFVFGEIRTSSTLRINEKGEWTEIAEVTVGSQPTRKFMELTVKPHK